MPTFTGGRYPTEFLSRIVREEQMCSLEHAHWRLSALPAHCAGFRDRGTLVEGAPADSTLEARLAAVISFYRWQEAVHDVPVDGDRGRGENGSDSEYAACCRRIGRSPSGQCDV